MSGKPFWKQDDLILDDEAIEIAITNNVVVRRWYLRLPIIRHIRALNMMRKINNHYDYYVNLGMIPWNAHSEYKIIRAVWDGKL
jgi:hypothetical protein